MLQLYKEYFILAMTRVTKKLIQQYVKPFLILEKVGRLTYILDISVDWKIHPVFSVAQLEPAPPLSLDLFSSPYLFCLSPVFMERDTIA